MNKNTRAEAQVDQIPGRSQIYHQAYFQGLKDEHQIALENVVFFKACAGGRVVGGQRRWRWRWQ